jgi:hypothetical protein
MIALRRCVFAFLLVLVLATLAYSTVGLVWTQTTLTQLYMPVFARLESYSEDASVVLYASDGTAMYQKDYRFAGRLNDDVDLSLPIFLLNELRDKQLGYDKRFTWWQRALFYLERIDPDTLESFIREHYANSLTALPTAGFASAKRGNPFQQQLLQYYIMRKLQGGYTERELYRIFFDAVYYEPDVRGLTGAARAYFDKAVNELNTLELCFLVAKATTNPEQSVQYHDKIARQFLHTLHI